MDPTVYIDGEKFNGISDFETIEYDSTERMKNTLQILLNNSPSITYTSKIKFIEPFVLYKLTGLYDFVIDNCHNKRVVHLIKNGKNDKIRKKNFNRAIRIIRKEIV